MHTTLTDSIRSTLWAAAIAGAAAGRVAAQQTNVEGMTSASSILQRAEAMYNRGQRDSATTVLSLHVAEQPTDGRAWFLLGRIYLANAREWHRAGHVAEGSGAAVFVDMAGSSFEPASELLTDSGGVFRVVVALERATLRIEKAGWDSLATFKTPAEELPLPPVLAELGRNLIASCPKNGVLVVGTSVAELASVWGIMLQGERGDLMVIRPDMYQWDPKYRGRVAAALKADSTEALPAILVAAAKNRPVCLGPGIDTIAAPGVVWNRSWLVLTTAPAVVPSSQFSLFRYTRTGVVGSVWTVAARDAYDLAARRNHAICSTLFATTYVSTPPTIPACSQ